MNIEFSTNFTVFPNDTNYNNPPSVFGGKVLAEMDNAAAMACKRLFYGTNVTDSITVGVNDVNFYKGALVGDLVFLTASVISLGKKSINIKVIGFKEDSSGVKQKICDGIFTFVSRIDGKPMEHNLKL